MESLVSHCVGEILPWHGMDFWKFRHLRILGNVVVRIIKRSLRFFGRNERGESEMQAIYVTGHVCNGSTRLAAFADSSVGRSKFNFGFFSNRDI